MNVEAAAPIKGARAEEGQGGRLLGALASWNMMLRRKNVASPARSRNPPSRKNGFVTVTGVRLEGV